jgi:hypothetical protein
LYDAFTEAYITALLWSNEMEDMHDLLSEEGEAKCIEDCTRFQSINLIDLVKWGDLTNAGHNFALNRNGHGTGFWDRGEGALGERLSRASHAMGEVDVYVDDNGLIQIQEEG